MVEVFTNDSEGTIELTATVDTSGASEAQFDMYVAMAHLFGSRYELFVDKNMSYGNSFVTQAARDYIDNPDRYRDLEHSILDNLDTRLGDKQSRAKNLLNGGKDRVGESYEDTVLDAMVYRALQGFIAQNDGSFIKKSLPEGINL